MSAHDCPRFNAYIRGCKFEARYDSSAVQIDFEGYGTANSIAVIEALKPKRYARDVCIHCGRTVERQS